MKQRLIRFQNHDDERLEAMARAQGTSVPMLVRGAALRALDDESASAVVREELQAARHQSTEQIEQMKAELKAFVFEAMVGLGDRVKASQRELVEQLVGELPQKTDTGSRLSEFFPSRPNPQSQQRSKTDE